MKNIASLLLGLAAIAATHCAEADTITTDLGTIFDGTVVEQPDGTYKITAGENVMVYRREEVVSIEKNGKDGKLDLEAIAAEVKISDERLTKLIGLDANQRARVDALLPGLAEEGPPRIKSREALLVMQAECDVYAYINYLYPESTQHFQAQMLDIMFRIDAGRAIGLVREALTHAFPDVRAGAIEILTRAGDSESADTIARGLVDPEISVRIVTSYALAGLNLRKATPALIACLPHPDLRVSNAAKDTLAALWKDVIGDTRPTTVDEWTAVWDAQRAGVNGALALDQLEPLADPAKPYVAG